LGERKQNCIAFLKSENLLDPRFAGSNPAVDNGFLRAIKIRSTTSFGGEVKPLVTYQKIERHV
jgi:hypothetical protein